ncbi:General secretion pathway protein C [Marinobacter salarius]|jgi:general secretion pathway protein C|uniref:type II secretion system protein N n=1 Tax=Marinobacter salarius TaxID=1420917 RepID=UPI001252E8D3|nr:type II secretion system protein N [Marinobacter salarius]MCZ4286823.1 general secretion pathway protein GspC [Marinobacter salarius]VVS98534.1 Type II secretion system protein C (GspC) [Marinobacter salarius]VXC38965.1 General secretion pathway protein C [Marinobacter salarius]
MLFTSSRLPLILTIVAGIAMITVTAWQGVRFWQNETSAGATTSTADMTMAETDTRKVPEVNLASFALFGEPGKEAPQTEPDTENLPETNLRLFLRGVLAASGDFPGSALIEDDKRNTEAYLVGDELPGNATLRSVRPNRIIIERSGKLENLYFPEDEDRTGLSMASTQTSNEQEEPSGTQIRSTGVDRRSTSTNTDTSDQRREEIRQRLEQLRERLRTNN